MLTKSLSNVKSDAEFQKICSKALKEVEIIRRAEERMIYKDCVIRTFGVAKGTLPSEVTTLFKIRQGEEGVGIIMRLEKGGSLDSLIHNPSKKKKKLTYMYTCMNIYYIILCKYYDNKYLETFS